MTYAKRSARISGLGMHVGARGLAGGGIFGDTRGTISGSGIFGGTDDGYFFAKIGEDGSEDTPPDSPPPTAPVVTAVAPPAPAQVETPSLTVAPSSPSAVVAAAPSFLKNPLVLAGAAWLLWEVLRRK